MEFHSDRSWSSQIVFSVEMTEILGTLICLKIKKKIKIKKYLEDYKEDEKSYLKNDLPEAKLMNMKNILLYFSSKNECIIRENNQH